MTFGNLTSVEWMVLLPVGILSLGAILLLLFSAIAPARGGVAVLKIFGTGIALAAAVALFYVRDLGSAFDGFFKADASAFNFAQIVLILAAASIPLSPRDGGAIFERPGSVISLLLLSACGGVVAAFSNELIVFFLGLELLSLPLYILAGVGTNRKKSSEAAFKYFLLGATSSALYVYGAALIFGGVGSTRIDELARLFPDRLLAAPGLLTVGTMLVLSGVAFKLGLVPFQMWVPDVYDGAPSFVVSWMSGAVKAAMVPFALKILAQVVPAREMNFSPVFAALSLASMLWGSFAALHQTNVKRMLAYSSIAHAGYVALGFVCAHEGNGVDAARALAYYLLTYGAASLVCFSILALDEANGRYSLSDLAGLARRRPGLALMFSLALLSLAGLPPLGGFFGKFYLFSLAIKKEYTGLVIVAVLTSLVSLGYYLRVIVAMYMEESKVTTLWELRFTTRTVLAAVTAAILFVGVFPSRVISFLSNPTFLSLK